MSKNVFNYDYAGNFKVNKSIQYTNFYSMCSNPIQQEVPADLFEGPPWQKQCAIMDLNKSVFRGLDEFNSDYLVIDVGNLREGLIEIENQLNEKTIVCSTECARPFYSSNEKLKQYGLHVDRIISPLDHDVSELNDALEFVCSELLKRFSPDRIIVNEVRYVDYYLTKINNLSCFSDQILSKGESERINKIYNTAERLLEQKLPGCNVIHFPKNVIGDEGHIWGLSPLNYVKEYYEYVNQALCIVTDSQGDKRKRLDCLYDTYDRILYRLKMRYDLNNISSPTTSCGLLINKLDTYHPFESLGMNTGNLLFMSSLSKLLSPSCIPYSYISKDIDLNSYKNIVTTDLIWIRSDSVFPHIEKLAEKYGGKIIPISIGLQDAYYNADFKLQDRTVNLLKCLQERCVLGVRGYYTAEILDKYGINNIEVIGCPSMYWNNSRGFKIRNNKVNLNQQIPTIVNFRTFWGTANIKERKFLRYCANHKFRFVEQTGSALTSKFLSNDLPFYNYISEYLNICKVTYFNAEEWRKSIEPYDFSIGLRFHGNVMMLRNGKKALFIIHDSRTKELTDYFKLPTINIQDFDETKPTGYYYNLADYTEFNKIYTEKFDIFVLFLKKNGIYNDFIGTI